MGGRGAPVSLLDRQKEFVGYLVKGFPELGLKPVSAVGAYAIAGNGSVENHMLPVTTGRKDHGSDAVLQWRLDRLNGPRGLKGWAAERGLPWDTLKTQAAFTLWELLQPRYKQLLADLREGKKSVDELTADFCWEFERPSRDAANLALRQRHARSVQKIMADEAIPPALDPVVNAPVSTLLGVVCWLLSYLKFDAVDPDAWLSWSILGFTLIFLIGGGRRHPPVEEEDEEPAIPLEQEKTDMSFAAIPKVLAIIEALVPVLQKALSDLPKIREDIAAIKEALNPEKQDGAADERLDRLKEIVGKL